MIFLFAHFCQTNEIYFSVEKMFSSIVCIASVSDIARLPQVRRQTAAYIRKWPCLGQGGNLLICKIG